jgi:NAD-dependent dihydropyrimidine dehydrogenase PreA subunit
VTDIDACVFCGVCAGRCPDFVFLIERGPRTTGREEGSLWLAD